ncbi:MAG: hypothetical protein EOP07_14125 [Proteobacteria bacterium]|nr:MAG: hypothetical protein EOP07_14125 [Pseudomonadota bacterium]
MKNLTKILLGLMALLALQSCQAPSTDSNSKKPSQTSDDQKSTSPIVTSTLPDESASIPSAITGALLVCFNETESEKSTLVSCGAMGKSDGKKLDLQTKYKDPSFTANNTATLKVEKESLPLNSKWHIRFRLSASNKDELSNTLKKVSFNFEAKNLSGVIVSHLEQTIVEYPKKLSSRIRNLKTLDDGQSMCMNSHYEAGYPDIVTLEPCNGKAPQDWALNGSNMIEWGMGSCLNMDKIQILHPRGCALPEATQWVKNGEEIRLKDSNTCLAMSDKYLLFGNVFPLPCDANDPMQHWVIEMF